MMTEREIERLAELVSIKVSERYLLISKELVKSEIRLHVVSCAAGKFSKIMGIACAVIGGSAVALVNWILRKY